MQNTANFESIPQILAEAHASIRRVQRIWPGWIPAEETSDDIIARFSRNDLLNLAWYELTQIDAPENPTLEQVWTANRWLEVVMGWADDQQRRCDALRVA